MWQRRVRCDDHRNVASRIALKVRIAAPACTPGSKYSYVRLPQVAHYSSEVSWVLTAKVITPKPL